MLRPLLLRSVTASLLAVGLLATGASAAPLRVLPTGGLRVESAALLMSGQEGGTIPFAVLALPFPGDSRARRVPA